MRFLNYINESIYHDTVADKVPRYVFHATYKRNLSSIMSSGILPYTGRNWWRGYSPRIYVAVTKYQVAGLIRQMASSEIEEDYPKVMSKVPGYLNKSTIKQPKAYVNLIKDILSRIVILKIDTRGLTNKFIVDANFRPKGKSLWTAEPIPASAIVSQEEYKDKIYQDLEESLLR